MILKTSIEAQWVKGVQSTIFAKSQQRTKIRNIRKQIAALQSTRYNYIAFANVRQQCGAKQRLYFPPKNKQNKSTLNLLTVKAAIVAAFNDMQQFKSFNKSYIE